MNRSTGGTHKLPGVSTYSGSKSTSLGDPARISASIAHRIHPAWGSPQEEPPAPPPSPTLQG